MLIFAFWILLAAALGGVTIAALDMGTAPVRAGHGGLAAIGLIVLLIGALGAGSGLAWVAFVLIALGFAAGGIFFGLVWRDSAPPRLLIIGHGLLNGIGVLLLGIAAFAG